MAVDPVSAYQPGETWYWDGLALSQPYWNVSTFGGARYNLPTLRGSNYQVPYRAGQAQRAKYPDQRTITLTMWVDGSKSPGGAVTGDARLAFNNYWSQLRAAFFKRSAAGSVQGQLTRNWHLTQDGTSGLVTATAMAEIAGSMDPTMNSRTNAVASIDFLLADPYFYGVQRTAAVTGSATVTANGEGVAGEGFPSPVAGFTVQVSRPCTVANTTAGVSFTVASGPQFPVTVDVLRDTVTDASGASRPGAVTHAGSRMWLCLLPGGNHITVSAGTATLTWNDPYV